MVARLAPMIISEVFIFPAGCVDGATAVVMGVARATDLHDLVDVLFRVQVRG